MKTYQELSKEELLELQTKLNAEYEDAKAKGLKLDTSRGITACNYDGNAGYIELPE